MYHRIAKIVTGTLAILLVSSTLALAASKHHKSSGTVVEVNTETGVYTVKDYDGKTYQLKKTDVVAENLKTGDTVEYEIIEGSPAHVHKKQ
jgi:hypothetical protein